MSKRKRIYRYNGMIERGAGRRYRWHEGFQLAVDEYGIVEPDHRTTYPWMTRKECKEEAKAKGCVAEFVYPNRGGKHGA